MRDDKTRLKKILINLVNIKNDFDPVQYQHNFFYRYGVAKVIENIGEEARCLSESTRNLSPGIPWSSIIGMRNILVHEYDDIDWDIILEVINNFTQDFEKQIEKLLILLNDQKN